MGTIKVEEIIIKDFKKLKDLKAHISGCNVFLRGPNGVGKSSFMDFIEIAFGKSSIVPPNTNIEGRVIIMKNGEKYILDVKLDGKGKVKVSITLPDGHRDTSKSVIAGIIGLNAFEIDKFVNLSTTEAGRKKQVEEFKEFLDEDTRKFLAKYETSIKTNFEERTDVNRDITKLEGAVKLSPMFNHTHELDSFTETKTEAVMEELKKAQIHNEKVNKVLSNNNERNQDIERANFEINELETKLLALKSEVATKTELNNQANEWLKTNTIQPTAALEKTISDAGVNNLKYIQAQDLKKELAKLEELNKLSDKLTKTIENDREMIQNAIRDMDGPIQGLGFDENQLLYNGIPVHPSSLSKSEIKKLGIRLKIAENPELPLFIHEAESMDENSLKEIQDIADECDLEMFAEEVQRGTTGLRVDIIAFN